MANYSQEFKLNLIEEIEANRFKLEELAQIYGIPTEILNTWYSSYITKGEAGLLEEVKENKDEQSLDNEFELKVIEDMRNNNLSRFEIFKRYKVTMAQIALWERKYFGDESMQNGEIKETLKVMKTFDQEQNIMSGKIDVYDLLEENRKLRAENQYLKKVNGLIKRKSMQ